MYTIKEIRIVGLTRIKTSIDTQDLEAFRDECARTYKVKKGRVKFVYDTKE